MNDINKNDLQSGDLNIEIKAAGEYQIINLSGVLNFENCKLFRDTINQLIQKGHKNFVIDLSKIEFVDSAGLGTIVGTKIGLSREEGSLSLSGVKGPVEELLARSRLLKLFSIYESPEEAITD